MSTEVQKDSQLELAHVLFIDIVGYSKLLITDQSEQLQKPKEIVRGTEQFRHPENGRQTAAVTLFPCMVKRARNESE